MATNSTLRLALSVAFLGSLAFIFGVVAENKKPASGTIIHGKGVVICKFPNDPTVALGSLSIVALVATAIVGHFAVFFPYKGKSVPQEVLFRSTSLAVFFFIAEIVSALALGMMMWATITEGLHISRNVHHDLSTQCPTAKTGLFGGAAFLALDAALFWLVCQMLTINARADYLDENDPKGEYGQVYSAEYESNGAAPKV
ncbi:uncharacterized protein LOC109708943 [Ananas comosus]|uniref:Uncharacterized protein LOC109708943 n=1 Tax=Ananas comosus TaxID=4615 RepID=A0A6P5ESL3_ANACO|nr:uncharacterized protein LOC109708943 [Ananas comosus]